MIPEAPLMFAIREINFIAVRLIAKSIHDVQQILSNTTIPILHEATYINQGNNIKTITRKEENNQVFAEVHPAKHQRFGIQHAPTLGERQQNGKTTYRNRRHPQRQKPKRKITK